jgi:hypothetical protein
MPVVVNDDLVADLLHIQARTLCPKWSRANCNLSNSVSRGAKG